MPCGSNAIYGSDVNVSLVLVLLLVQHTETRYLIICKVELMSQTTFSGL